MPAHKPRPLPKIGAVFERNYNGVVHRMVVVKTDRGVGYKVGGKVYKTTTAAAKAAIGKDWDVNGPKFWRLDKTES